MYILLIYFLLINFISLTLLMLNFLISKKFTQSREKISPFECGFDPINSPRLPFSIHFYIISIIFLIFDVEIIIFIPLILTISQTQIFLWLNISIYFILILFLGLYFEYNSGVFKWVK